MTAKWMFALLIAVAGSAPGCKKQEAAPPPADNRPPPMPEAELRRGADACNAYVDKVCACASTVAAAKERCALAKSLPEAIEVARQVSMSKDSVGLDVLQAADSIRKTVAQCIEQTAQLPTLGC